MASSSSNGFLQPPQAAGQAPGPVPSITVTDEMQFVWCHHRHGQNQDGDAECRGCRLRSQRIELLVREIRRLRDAVRHLEHERDVVLIQNEELHIMVLDRERNLESWKMHLDDVNGLVSELHTKIASLQDRNEAVEDENQQLQDEWHQLAHRYEEVVTNNHHLRTMAIDLEPERRMRIEFQRRFGVSERLVKITEERLEELQAELQAMKVGKEKLQTEIERMKAGSTPTTPTRRNLGQDQMDRVGSQKRQRLDESDSERKVERFTLLEFLQNEEGTVKRPVSRIAVMKPQPAATNPLMESDDEEGHGRKEARQMEKEARKEAIKAANIRGMVVITGTRPKNQRRLIETEQEADLGDMAIGCRNPITGDRVQVGRAKHSHSKIASAEGARGHGERNENDNRSSPKRPAGRFVPSMEPVAESHTRTSQRQELVHRQQPSRRRVRFAPSAAPEPRRGQDEGQLVRRGSSRDFRPYQVLLPFGQETGAAEQMWVLGTVTFEPARKPRDGKVEMREMTQHHYPPHPMTEEEFKNVEAGFYGNSAEIQRWAGYAMLQAKFAITSEAESEETIRQRIRTSESSRKHMEL